MFAAHAVSTASTRVSATEDQTYAGAATAARLWLPVLENGKSAGNAVAPHDVRSTCRAVEARRAIGSKAPEGHRLAAGLRKLDTEIWAEPERVHDSEGWKYGTQGRLPLVPCDAHEVREEFLMLHDTGGWTQGNAAHSSVARRPAARVAGPKEMLLIPRSLEARQHGRLDQRK